MTDINTEISKLIKYALDKKLIMQEDKVYATNALLEKLKIGDYTECEVNGEVDLESNLKNILDFANEKGLVGTNTVVERDLFDTALMGVLTPRPSEVIKTFNEKLNKSPKDASDYFYGIAKNSDYIRTYRVKKDMKWKVDSEYGKIDITVNLSKPEKDPRAIAAAKLAKPTGYPKCLLCHENEGFCGSMALPARQTLRQIPLTIGGELWYLQYSPYVYYNEHCIVLNSEHTPMKISKKTFERMFDFIDYLPHYTVGSNADLPIVGGSILSHDHMQGGSYVFPMANAPKEREFVFPGFKNVKASILHWPLSVIRLDGKDKKAIVELSDKILTAWRGYTDDDAFIFANTNGEDHNTITPIARKNGKEYEIDLVLRNNITTDDHPFGVYHPHEKLHNIKKENIGLIEVMGLAVLPARLKAETELLAGAVQAGNFDFKDDEKIGKHFDWFNEFKDTYDFKGMTVDEITEKLKTEIGKTFVKVLEDAGVYKCTKEGRAAFDKFINFVK